LTIVFVLIVASALVGLATGYVYKIWALVLTSPLIAVFSAIILRVYEFGMKVWRQCVPEGRQKLACSPSRLQPLVPSASSVAGHQQR